MIRTTNNFAEIGKVVLKNYNRKLSPAKIRKVILPDFRDSKNRLVDLIRNTTKLSKAQSKRRVRDNSRGKARFGKVLDLALWTSGRATIVHLGRFKPRKRTAGSSLRIKGRRYPHAFLYRANKFTGEKSRVYSREFGDFKALNIKQRDVQFVYRRYGRAIASRYGNRMAKKLVKFLSTFD